MNLRAWLLPLAACALVALAVPVAADEPVPDAATLLAKVREASGPVAEVYRQVEVSAAGDGTPITDRQYHRGKNWRTVRDMGPFHTERGVNAGSAWHMNENGQVVIDEPDPGVATREATRVRVTRTQTPVDGYIVSQLTARGAGLVEYIDGARWAVVRVDRVTPNGTIVTTYDDIRPDHGRTFAHHIQVADAVAKTLTDRHVTEYVPDEAGEGDVAVPAPRRNLVVFPPGTTSVELPAKFGPGHIYVRVMIGDRGLDFVLDTGASGITIDSDVARELHLRAYDTHQAVTAGAYTTARAIVPEMRVGTLTMHDVAVREIPQGWNTAPDVKEVGLLGFDFLAELGVTIDYERGRVSVVPASAYAPPFAPNTIPLAVRIGSGQPHTTVAVNGAIGERFILDTGGAGTFLIFDYFARRHPEALRDEGRGPDRNIHIRGIGGDVAVVPYQLASLKLSNVNFTHFLGYRVANASAYAFNDDGVIGSDFLKLFTVSLDYADSKVYLVPNKDGRAAMGIK
jgi:predicted aspartyl protease